MSARTIDAKLLLVPVILLGAIASQTNAQMTFYVNRLCGDDAWTGTSPTCQAPDGPKATIQAGINAGVNGDEVVISDGEYSGPGNIDLDFGGRLIVVRSRSGPSACVIDCRREGRGFVFHSGETPDAVVEGLTIRNGVTPDESERGTDGGGILCDGGSPTIRDCRIVENTAGTQRFDGAGGGIAVSGAMTLIKCEIRGNLAGGEGGGVYCREGATLALIDCVIAGNSAYEGGGIYSEIGPLVPAITLTNSAIAGNSASRGGAIYNDDGRLTISSCTIAGNFAQRGAGLYSGRGNVAISNSILWDAGPLEISQNTGVLRVDYSVVRDGWPGDGNVDSDPLLVDAEFDWRLRIDSPCIDAGDNTTVPPGVQRDLFGNPRFADDPETPNTGNGIPPIVDIGAHEFQHRIGPPDLVTHLQASDGVFARRVALTWRHSQFAQEYRVYRNDRDDPNTAVAISDWQAEAGLDDRTAEPGATYWYWVRARSRHGESDLSVGVSGRRRVARTIHVPTERPTLQAGIDAAEHGDVVLVAPGTYRGAGNKNLAFDGKRVILRAVGGPDLCIIDCERSGRGFNFVAGETRETIVEGFTITNGYVRLGEPGGGAGGGIMMRGAGPTIVNCIIDRNTAEGGGGAINCDTISRPLISGCTISRNVGMSGGGILCNGLGSDATIIHCTITENSTTWLEGGGVYCTGNNTTITNCLIAGNVSLSHGGGIMYRGGDPPIVNCTIVGNTAVEIGGGVFCESGVFLDFRNCIFWANSAPFGAQMAVRRSTSTLAVAYCDVQGGRAGVFTENGPVVAWGAGNFDLEPRFRDAPSADFHLRPDSPCIEAGDEFLVPLNLTEDLDGNPRVVDDPCTPNPPTGVVDVGVYEFQLACRADLDGSGTVDRGDLEILLADFGCTGGSCPGDIDCDGDTDLADLGILLATFGRDCP